MTLKDQLPRLVGAQYSTGDQWGNNSRKNEEIDWNAKVGSQEQPGVIGKIALGV